MTKKHKHKHEAEGTNSSSAASSSSAFIRSSPSSIEALLNTDINLGSPDTNHNRLQYHRVLSRILTLSWPISLTTLFESLPLILITALVGHADPNTALPPDDPNLHHRTGANLLEVFGLGNLVYSTCAFAIVYGIASGLDSVAPTAAAVDEMENLALTSTSHSSTMPRSSHSYQSLADDGTILARSTYSSNSPASPLSPSVTGRHTYPRAQMLGTWAMRCIYLQMLICVLIMTTLYFSTGPALRAMGEPTESIDSACRFVNALLIGLPFVAVYYTLSKALQAYGVVVPVMIIVVIVKSLAVVLIWFQLFRFGSTIVSTALTLSVAAFIQMVILYIYMRRVGIVEAWWPSTREDDIIAYEDRHQDTCISGLRGIIRFACFAIPACLAVCLEFTLFDLVGFLSGLVPPSASSSLTPSVELSTHYLLFSSCFAGFMVFSGVSVGVSVTVGRHLGIKGEASLAQRAAKCGMLCCVTISMMLILIIATCHEYIAAAFTADLDVRQRFAQCVPVLICFTAFDGLNTCSTQLIRTLGVQRYGVIVHFTSYYLVGVGIGSILAFWYGLGVFGLWIGMAVGVGLNSLLCSGWLWLGADWSAQAEEARQRTDVQYQYQHQVKHQLEFDALEFNGQLNGLY